MTVMKPRAVSLTDGNITSGIVKFAIPVLLSNLLQQLYNSIDSAVLGHFAGADALAAVGSTGALINLLIGFFLGVATGTGVLFSMHYGAEDYPGLKKLIDSAMILSVIIAVVVSFFGITFADQLLHILNTPEELMQSSREYLVIFLSGLLATMIYNTGAGIIRAEGDSIRPLIYLAIGGVGNLVTDILFVAVFDWGVKGAAWATVISQAITAVLVTVHMTRFNPVYAYHPLHMKADKIVLWDIIRISVPCGLQNAMYDISNLLVQIKLNSFGMMVMAGATAFGKINAFVYMPMSALSLSCSTFVGQNLGAGRFRRIKKGIMTCVWLGLVISFGMCLVTLFGYNTFIRLFTDEPEAAAYGRMQMYFILPVVWFYSMTDTYGGAIRGSGQSVAVTVILAVCICVFRVVWIEIMLRFIYDVKIVYACYPLSWFLSTITTIWFFYRRSTIWKTICEHQKATLQAEAAS